jgi:hypothetical protein
MVISNYPSRNKIINREYIFNFKNHIRGSPIWEADCWTAGQEISFLLLNSYVQNHVHRNVQFDHILIHKSHPQNRTEFYYCTICPYWFSPHHVVLLRSLYYFIHVRFRSCPQHSTISLNRLDVPLSTMSLPSVLYDKKIYHRILMDFRSYYECSKEE